jgi:hypothetical protein
MRSRKRDELPASNDDMLPEYDFKGGVRGKYARDYGAIETCAFSPLISSKSFPTPTP